MTAATTFIHSRTAPAPSSLLAVLGGAAVLAVSGDLLLKGASCRIVNQVVSRSQPLRWASSYDLHSVGRRSMPTISRYLDRQGAHHNEQQWVRWPVWNGTAFPMRNSAA